MHTVKLQIEDSVFDKVIYFLKNLPQNEVHIIDEDKTTLLEIEDEKSDINAYANHSANTIDEWKEDSEDTIWK